MGDFKYPFIILREREHNNFKTVGESRNAKMDIPDKAKRNPGYLINIVFIVLLSMIAVARYISLSAFQPIFEGKFFSIEGLVLNYPYDKGPFQIIKLKDKYLKAPMYPRYKLGDYLKVTYPQDKDFISFPHISVIEEKSSHALNSIDDFRTTIVERARSSLPEPDAGLILGMTIGFKEPFTDNFNDMLINAGVIHIIVVSGYNVSLMQSMLAPFASRAGRWVFLLVNIVFLLFYLLMVGLEAPIIRAVIMGSFGSLGLFLGRKKDSFYLLIITGLLMVIYKPSFLIDLSFQLTFISTFAVMYLNNYLWFVDGFKKEVLITILISLFMFPLISFYFGRVSVAGILANILISWVVPVVTVVGFVYLAAGILPIRILIICLIDYFLSILKLTEKLSFINFNISIGLKSLILIYVVILGSFTFIKYRYIGDKPNETDI